MNLNIYISFEWENKEMITGKQPTNNQVQNMCMRRGKEKKESEWVKKKKKSIHILTYHVLRSNDKLSCMCDHIKRERKKKRRKNNRKHKNKNKEKLKEIVISALKQASLYEEVKNRLKDSALGLSGGQQQRLCIARCIAMKPDVILMDEPTSALDPIATLKIENLIQELKKEYTIIIVTHNMQQATRISDYTAFFLMGEVIEYENTTELFTNPKNSKTEDYITGRFG